MWFTFTWRPFWFYGFLRRGNLVQLAKCVDFCFRFFLISAYFIHINSCICPPRQQTFRQQINKIIFWMDFTPAIDTFEILKFFSQHAAGKSYIYTYYEFSSNIHTREPWHSVTAQTNWQQSIVRCMPQKRLCVTCFVFSLWIIQWLIELNKLFRMSFERKTHHKISEYKVRQRLPGWFLLQIVKLVWQVVVLCVFVRLYNWNVSYKLFMYEVLRTAAIELKITYTYLVSIRISKYPKTVTHTCATDISTDSNCAAWIDHQRIFRI